jgi:hypothetical protein
MEKSVTAGQSLVYFFFEIVSEGKLRYPFDGKGSIRGFLRSSILTPGPIFILVAKQRGNRLCQHQVDFITQAQFSQILDVGVCNCVARQGFTYQHCRIKRRDILFDDQSSLNKSVDGDN